MAGPSSELADGHARQDLRRGGRAWPRGARDADRGRTGGGQALAGPAPLRAHRMTGSTMPHPTIYTDHLITADELAAMPEHARFELVLGRLVPVAPASTDHGEIGSNLTYLVMHHVRTHKLGRTYIAETGFDMTRPTGDCCHHDCASSSGRSRSSSFCATTARSNRAVNPSSVSVAAMSASTSGETRPNRSWMARLAYSRRVRKLLRRSI